MIKAILFDLDNTLIDFMRMKKASCDAAISEMIKAGLNMRKDEALKVLYSLYAKYGIEYHEIFQRFLEEVHKKVDYKILAAGIVAYRHEQPQFLKPYMNVAQTLKGLKAKGLRLGIVSDAPRLKVWERLTEMKIQDLFDVVVGFGDVEERKPSKIPFEKALKELDFHPEEVLMVGDWPERDILGAKNLGMRTCLARYGYTTEKPLIIKADYDIDDISELLEIV